jgi:hypothetical protein
MTKKEIVSLSLKLAGIYCLIMAITHLSYTIQSVVYLFRQEDIWSIQISINSFVSLLLILIPFVLLPLFGFYLFFSDKLPSKMASLMTQEEKTSSFTFQDIQALSFSIIGVWLLSSVIPAFIQLIVQIMIYHRTSFQSISPLRDSIYISHIIAAVLKIALGIYLFSGGKGLIRLWQKFDNTKGMKPYGNN